MVGKMQTKNLHTDFLDWHTDAVKEFKTQSNKHKIQDQLDFCSEIHSGLSKLYNIARDKVPSDNHSLYVELKKQINLVQNTEMKLSHLLIMTKADNEKRHEEYRKVNYGE
jgi:hypothetical protein